MHGDVAGRAGRAQDRANLRLVHAERGHGRRQTRRLSRLLPVVRGQVALPRPDNVAIAPRQPHLDLAKPAVVLRVGGLVGHEVVALVVSEHPPQTTGEIVGSAHQEAPRVEREGFQGVAEELLGAPIHPEPGIRPRRGATDPGIHSPGHEARGNRGRRRPLRPEWRRRPPLACRESALRSCRRPPGSHPRRAGRSFVLGATRGPGRCRRAFGGSPRRNVARPPGSHGPDAPPPPPRPSPPGPRFP